MSSFLLCRGAAIAPWVAFRVKDDPTKILVDDTGIEPVTPSMSTKCSTAELIIHVCFGVNPTPYNKIGRGVSRVSRAVYKRSRGRDQGLLKNRFIGLCN